MNPQDAMIRSFGRQVIAGLLLALMAIFPGVVLAAAVAPTPPAKSVSPLPPDSVGGRIVPLRAGADLQAALNAAKPNDTLVLEAGATWTGNFMLPRRSDSGWVTIRSSAEGGALPPAGRRVSPNDTAAMPKIVTPNSNPALTAADGTQGWRLVGLEFSLIPTWNNVVYHLIGIGWGSGPWGRRVPTDVVASRFIVERCYIHGSPAQKVQKGILANGSDIRIADSWIDEIHNSGFDSQAILSYDGAGPYLIENNELQASSENIMFGGSDPSGPEYLPSDIVIRRNHIIKPLRWKADDPSYDGRAWVIKPLIELKIAQRILIEGNILENSWGWPAFVFDAGGTPGLSWIVVQDVMFRYNRIINATCPWQGWTANAPIRRVAILHNLSDEAVEQKIGNAYTRGAVGNLLSSKKHPMEDIWIEHNTLTKAARGITISGGSFMPRFTMRNNAFPYGPAVEGHWVWKDPNNPNPNWAVSPIAPDRDIRRNALFGLLSGPGRVVYDDSEFRILPSPQAAGMNPDGTLQPTSPLKGAATDGTDIGVDFVGLGAALGGGSTGNR